ncbi:MAG TPA: hypothetical protein VK888_09945 [Anaerolineales bacterium]|nr:hypothetical protein [Anaerolineales bacterium]
MNNQVAEALVVTHSIVLQQGLGALLESLPGITKVIAIKDLSNMYAWIEANKSLLLLLDLRVTGQDPKSVLARVHEISPETRRVLLVDDVQDVNWVPRYADAILIKGIPPQAVATLLNNILSSKGDKDGHDDPIP